MFCLSEMNANFLNRLIQFSRLANQFAYSALPKITTQTVKISQNENNNKNTKTETSISEKSLTSLHKLSSSFGSAVDEPVLF